MSFNKRVKEEEKSLESQEKLELKKLGSLKAISRWEMNQTMEPTPKQRKAIVSKVVIRPEESKEFESPYQNSIFKSLDQNSQPQLESPRFDQNLKYLRGNEPESDLTLDIESDAKSNKDPQFKIYISSPIKTPLPDN